MLKDFFQTVIFKAKLRCSVLEASFFMAKALLLRRRLNFHRGHPRPMQEQSAVAFVTTTQPLLLQLHRSLAAASLNRRRKSRDGLSHLAPVDDGRGRNYNRRLKYWQVNPCSQIQIRVQTIQSPSFSDVRIDVESESSAHAALGSDQWRTTFGAGGKGQIWF